MRHAGWLPHEHPQLWDRSELSYIDDVPLQNIGQEVARKIENLQARAAAPQPLPLRRLPLGGVRIGCGHVPPQPLPRPTTHSTDATRPGLYDAVVADVASGALERGDARVFGRLFMGAKGRPLFDPSWTNTHIEPGAKAVAMGSVRDMTAAGVVATKMDLKSAFRSVVVHPDDRPLLGVELDGVALRYARLPFGLASSPRLFCLLLRETLADIPVPDGHAIIDYVDDIAVLGSDAQACATLTAVVAERLLDDGWRIACAKTFARPTKSLLFLGFAVNVPQKAVAITPPRLAKAIDWMDMVEGGTSGWRRVLEKLLGLAAWASPALRGAGFVAPPLYRALRLGAMDGEGLDALGLLREIFKAALLPTPLRPPQNMISLVTDAGDTAWCAALCCDGQIKAIHRGPLPQGGQEWSSTAREAVAVVEGVAAFGAGLDLANTGVHVQTDSKALAFILNKGRTRSPEVARALERLQGLWKLGLKVEASWVRRSEGFQPTVDAGTARSSCWRPGVGLLRWVQGRGPVDLHVGAASRQASIALRYTADIDDESRAEAIARLPGTWCGWVGAGTDTPVHGLRVFCHPRWGQEPKVVRALRAAAEVLVLTKRTPALATLFAGWPGSVDAIRPPLRHHWWILDSHGRPEHTIRAPELVLLHWRSPGASQAAADRELRLAQACALHPGPGPPKRRNGRITRRHANPFGPPLPLGGLAREAAARLDAEWTRHARQILTQADPTYRLTVHPPQDALATLTDEGTASMVRTWAVLPLQAGWPHAARNTDGVAAPHFGATAAQATHVPPPGTVGPCATTCGHTTTRGPAPQRLVDLLRTIGSGCPAMDQAVGPQILQQAAAAFERVATARRRRRRGRTRAELAAQALASYAVAHGAVDAPATPGAIDALAISYADARIQGIRDMRPVAPSTVAEEMSSLAAALRAHGFHVEAYLGPMTAAYLRARGASQRSDVSNALPLLLKWLLSVEPERDDQTHAIWASRVAQSGFMLRPGVAGKLRKGNLVPWGPGYVLTWPARDKTRPGDVCQPDGLPQRLWRVTACGHPAVRRVLDHYRANATGPGELLWPQATPAATMAWLRQVRPVEAEETPRLTAHGFRLGCDLELHELGAPPDVINVLGWWAQESTPGKATRAYYSSTHLGRMMMVTAQLGQSTTAHPAPGVHSGTPAPTVVWEALWETYATTLPARPPAIRQAAYAAAAAAASDAVQPDSDPE